MKFRLTLATEFTISKELNLPNKYPYELFSLIRNYFQKGDMAIYSRLLKKTKNPRIVRRGQLKCFHNGIILIVIRFKLLLQIYKIFLIL